MLEKSGRLEVGAPRWEGQDLAEATNTPIGSLTMASTALKNLEGEKHGKTPIGIRTDLMKNQKELKTRIRLCETCNIMI